MHVLAFEQSRPAPAMRPWPAFRDFVFPPTEEIHARLDALDIANAALRAEIRTHLAELRAELAAMTADRAGEIAVRHDCREHRRRQRAASFHVLAAVYRTALLISLADLVLALECGPGGTDYQITLPSVPEQPVEELLKEILKQGAAQTQELRNIRKALSGSGKASMPAPPHNDNGHRGSAGRPPKYDWELNWAHWAVDLRGGKFPDSIAEAVERMADVCNRNGLPVPSDESLARRARMLLRAYGRRD